MFSTAERPTYGGTDRRPSFFGGRARTLWRKQQQRQHSVPQDSLDNVLSSERGSTIVHHAFLRGQLCVEPAEQLHGRGEQNAYKDIPTHTYNTAAGRDWLNTRLSTGLRPICDPGSGPPLPPQWVWCPTPMMPPPCGCGVVLWCLRGCCGASGGGRSSASRAPAPPPWCGGVLWCGGLRACVRACRPPPCGRGVVWCLRSGRWASSSS